MAKLIVGNTYISIYFYNVDFDGDCEFSYDLKIDIKNNYLDYHKETSYIWCTDYDELECFLDDIVNLLDGKLEMPKVHEFNGVDFKLCPPKNKFPEQDFNYYRSDDENVSLVISVDLSKDHIWEEGAFTVCLNRDEIVYFYIQLARENYPEPNMKLTEIELEHPELVELNKKDIATNSSSINENLKKYKCAKAKYRYSYGKVYTFLVEDFVNASGWYVEDSAESVDIVSFCELNENELPVHISRMKYIYPIDTTLPTNTDYSKKEITKFKEYFITEDMYYENDKRYCIYHRVEDAWGVKFQVTDDEYMFLDENEFEEIYPFLSRYMHNYIYDYYDFSYVLYPRVWKKLKADFENYINKNSNDESKIEFIRYLDMIIYYIDEYIKLGVDADSIGIYGP